jgi:hypothetical protein
MIRNLGVHGADPADVVRDFAQVRPQLANIHPALAVLLKRERGFHQLAGAPLSRDRSAGQRLTVVLVEHRLGIEAVDVRASTVHEQKNHTLDPLRMIQFRDAHGAVRSDDSASAHE